MTIRVTVRFKMSLITFISYLFQRHGHLCSIMYFHNTFKKTFLCKQEGLTHSQCNRWLLDTWLLHTFTNHFTLKDFQCVKILNAVIVFFLCPSVDFLQISHSPPPAWCFPKGFRFIFRWKRQRMSFLEFLAAGDKLGWPHRWSRHHNNWEFLPQERKQAASPHDWYPRTAPKHHSALCGMMPCQQNQAGEDSFHASESRFFLYKTCARTAGFQGSPGLPWLFWGRKIAVCPQG